MKDRIVFLTFGLDWGVACSVLVLNSVKQDVD